MRYRSLPRVRAGRLSNAVSLALDEIETWPMSNRPTWRSGPKCSVIRLLAAALIVSGTPACSSANDRAAPTEASATEQNSGHILPEKPNVLFILADDMTFDDVAFMPNLKELLIDHGTSFSRYYGSVSLCCPARVTTLRGQYSHNSGVLTNGGVDGGFRAAFRLGIESDTIATWLQAGGYRTSLFGKYLNGYPGDQGVEYIPPGWTNWASSVKGSAYGEYNYTLNENGTLTRYGDAASDYGTDVYARKADDFIRQAAKDRTPFFTYLSVYAPHAPSTPAPRHLDDYPGLEAPRPESYNEADVTDKPEWLQAAPLLGAKMQTRTDENYRKRIQSLGAVDDAIATLVDTLTATDQLKNTYIVFSSDNGFHLGEHRLPSGKQTAFETDIHLPLIVRGPGVPEGVTVDHLVGNTDLAPTFADMAGVSAAPFVDGRSFLPLLRTNPPAVDTWRQAFLIEHWPLITSEAVGNGSDGLEPTDDDQKGASADASSTKGNNIPEFHGLRTGPWTYVEYITGEHELYDNSTDPSQLENIAKSADPVLLAKLSATLALLRSCVAETCRSIENKPLG